MLAYENEAIFAQQNKQAIDYTVPDSTILIENPIAVTSNSAHPAEAKAFQLPSPSDPMLSPRQRGDRKVLALIDSRRARPSPTSLL